MLPAVPRPVPMLVHLHAHLRKHTHIHTHTYTHMHACKVGLQLHPWKDKSLQKPPFFFPFLSLHWVCSLIQRLWKLYLQKGQNDQVELSLLIHFFSQSSLLKHLSLPLTHTLRSPVTLQSLKFFANWGPNSIPIYSIKKNKITGFISDRIWNWLLCISHSTLNWILTGSAVY